MTEFPDWAIREMPVLPDPYWAMSNVAQSNPLSRVRGIGTRLVTRVRFCYTFRTRKELARVKIVITIYVRDMEINHFFEVTACKSKHHLPKFYIYILCTILSALNFLDLLIKNWRRQAMTEAKEPEPEMQIAVTDKS